MNRILFPNSDGGVAIVVPHDGVSLEEVVRLSVPTGAPYRVVSAEDIPSDRSERDLWTADFSEPDGYGGVS